MNTTHQTFIVTVETSKPIPNLADKIAQRLWSLDGVVSAEAVEHSVRPAARVSTLPAPLMREAAAVGAGLDADSIEHGEVTL